MLRYGVTHPVRFYEGGGTYPLRGFPPLLSRSACCVRCGGSSKRGYGMTYSGTKGETLDTDKADPSGLPRQLSTLPGFGWMDFLYGLRNQICNEDIIEFEIINAAM